MGDSNGAWGVAAEHSDELAQVWDSFARLPEPGQSDPLDAFCARKHLDIPALVRIGTRLSAPTVIATMFPGGIRYRDLESGKQWSYLESDFHSLKIVRRAEPSDRVILAEGQSDAARLTMLYPEVDVAVLPAGAKRFTRAFAQQLVDYRQILVGLDNDEAGEAGAAKIQALLPHAVRFAPPAGAGDWCELVGEPPALPELSQTPEPEPRLAEQLDSDAAEDKETDREAAARLARGAELFRSRDGIAYATFSVNGHRETRPVRAHRFKLWVQREFEKAKGKTPSADALNIAQSAAESAAIFDGPVHEVYTRVAHVADRVYLDLVDEQWRAVEISADGWKVIENPPVKFQRAHDAVALPEPARGGSLDEALRPFVNVTDAGWPLVKAWLVGSMSAGPYPLLVLYGQQGSAKSSTSRRLRQAIDPARTATRETPSRTHDLAIAAHHCWILAYDNLSWLSSAMSDALCRLATGGGFGTRTLYANDEETTFYAIRPVILNGIEEVATRGDLLSRAIVLQCPPLQAVVDERTLDAEFEAAHPQILGGLLDAVSCALRRWDTVTLSDAPRMADFARWVCAAVPALRWSEDEFLAAYQENRAAGAGAEIDSSVFASTLVEFIESVGEWTGTASELLGELTSRRGGDHGKGWPTHAKAVADRLRRHTPALASHGVTVEFRRSHGVRQVHLRSADGVPAVGAEPRV